MDAEKQKVISQYRAEYEKALLLHRDALLELGRARVREVEARGEKDIAHSNYVGQLEMVAAEVKNGR